MNNGEMIKQLEEVSSLLNDLRKVDEYLEEGVTINGYEKFKAIKAEAGNLPDIPAGIVNLPILKEQKIRPDDLKAEKYFVIALGTACCSLVVFSCVKWALALLVFIVSAIYLAILAKPTFETSKAIKTNAAASEEFVNALSSVLANFEEQKVKGFESAKAYGEKYRAAYAKLDAVIFEMEEEKNQARDEHNKIVDKIKKYDFVTEEYIHLVPMILSLMKSGRADSYKEALNLAIREEREEVAENERREAEERRTAIMEQQAREERFERQRAREEQERHNRAIERQQADAAEKARRDRMTEENRARRRCANCKKRYKCHAGTPINCGAYDPE